MQMGYFGFSQAYSIRQLQNIQQVYSYLLVTGGRDKTYEQKLLALVLQ